MPRTRRHPAPSPKRPASGLWPRRILLLAVAATILALFLLSSRLEPTEAAAGLERVIQSWIDQSTRPR